MEGMREIRGFIQRWEDKHPLCAMVILSKVHKPDNFESLNSPLKLS